jgi:hypothetical protein
MKQLTLAMAADQNAECEKYRRPTKRDERREARVTTVTLAACGGSTGAA